MWLLIVLVLGIAVILIQSSLESVVVYLERRGLIQVSSHEWFSNDTLQLQRMVHEELGLGDWQGCSGSNVIPVTRKGQLLGVFDAGDPQHPRLKKPKKEKLHICVAGSSSSDKPSKQESIVKHCEAGTTSASTDGLQTESSVAHVTVDGIEIQGSTNSQDAVTPSGEDIEAQSILSSPTGLCGTSAQVHYPVQQPTEQHPAGRTPTDQHRISSRNASSNSSTESRTNFATSNN